MQLPCTKVLALALPLVAFSAHSSNFSATSAKLLAQTANFQQTLTSQAPDSTIEPNRPANPGQIITDPTTDPYFPAENPKFEPIRPELEALEDLRAFDELDQNDDGVISADEYPQDQIQRDLLRSMDAAGDGLIYRRDFEAFRASPPEQ